VKQVKRVRAVPEQYGLNRRFISVLFDA